MKHAIYGIVRAWGVCPGQQWHFIYLCCILYRKCGVDHGMGSQITVCVWRVCKGQLLCMFWRSQLSVLQRHNLIWHVDRRMNRQTNWWMVWKLERLWDPPRGITDPLFPWNKQACFTVPKESKIVFLCSMFPNFAFVPCSTQNVTFVPCSPGINVISPVSQNPWEGLHYVDVIFSHIEQKRGQ